MTGKIKYPEMLDYEWVREMDAVVRNSKATTKGDRLYSEIPPAPMTLVMTILNEMHNRPEILSAHASAKPHEKLGERESHLLTWFHEYLTHKYGNETKAVSAATMFMRSIANGGYTGLDDPKLKSDLSRDWRVSADDEKTNGTARSELPS